MSDTAAVDTGENRSIGGHFRPGQSGNPKGRPRGARSKFSEEFVAAFAEDFEAHGKVVIEKVRTESPQTYLKVAASLVPKQMEVDEMRPSRPAAELSDDDLAAIIRGTKATA